MNITEANAIAAVIRHLDQTGIPDHLKGDVDKLTDRASKALGVNIRQNRTRIQEQTR